jgi:hypothetical protein
MYDSGFVVAGESIAAPSPVRDLNRDTMPTLDELFTHLANAVREGAKTRGFEESPENGQPGPFGGRIARWRRGAEELVLLWDAKEQWVNFEFRPSPDRPPALEWTGTLSDRFTGHNITDADMHQLREDLTGILATVWARRRLS